MVKRNVKERSKRFLAAVMTAAMVCGNLGAPAYAYEADVDGYAARDLSKDIAEEGMVLLKNDDSTGSTALPLSQGEKVAVFGINQIDYIYGGGGSANLTTEYAVSLLEGLQAKEEEGKVQLYSDLINSYQEYYDDYWANDGRTYSMSTKQGALLYYQGEMSLDQEAVEAAAAEADTAIVTIGRPIGEGDDRLPSEFNLSEKEAALVESVKAAGFDKVIAILNVGAVIDTSWIDDEVDAALLVYFPGMEGGNAMADVLCGDAYPSGKLVDTWADKYESYPSSENFGNEDYTNYEEDIFVGYRYFETIPGAAEHVNYPFGYGLSYADFEIQDASVTCDGDTVTATAVVVNNSDKYAGKEVVQLYYGAPDKKLTQPKKQLGAYVKTEEIAPGESTQVTISMNVEDMASYDDVGKTGNEACYVLEDGTYQFYLGNSVRDAELAGTWTNNSTYVTEELAHRLVPDTDKLTRRMTSDGSYEKLEQTYAAEKTPDEAEELFAEIPQVDDPFITFNDVAAKYVNGDADARDTLTAFVDSMEDDDLIDLGGCVSPAANKGHRTGIGGISKYGIPLIGTSNGPNGIQYNSGDASDPEKNSTFFPSATMQASTWNEDLIELEGIAMGMEARHFGMSLWQAPGLNIHRDPLCGRNFEYYSEDPLIAGNTAAAVCNGIQSQKVAAQPKHFAANNQELGRHENDSRVSERALRQIYLKPFEIAVKEADPQSMMSSYNLINGKHSSSSYELLTEILRNEWGFTGFVMTDFNTTPAHVDELIGGGDLKAPAGAGQSSALKAALGDGTIERWQLERAADNILRFMLWTEDGEAAATTPFTYTVSLSFSGDIVGVKEQEIRMDADVTVETLMNLIEQRYNQKYELFAEEGTLIACINPDNNGASDLMAEDSASLEEQAVYGMYLVVTAEDKVTSGTYVVSEGSLGTVRSSGIVEGSSANLAVDGDETTGWIVPEDGNWLEIDLENVRNLTKVNVLFGGEGEYEYEIWVNDEDAEWDNDRSADKDLEAAGYQLVASETANAADGTATVVFDDPDESVRARCVVIKVVSSTAETPSICEFEALGWWINGGELLEVDDENRTLIAKSMPVSYMSAALSGLGTKGDCAIDRAWMMEGLDGALNLISLNFLDGNGNRVSYVVVLAEQYHVTVSGGTADPEDACADDVVTIKATSSDADKRFVEWSGEEDLEFVNGTTRKDAEAQFKMPAHDVELEAVYADGTVMLTVENGQIVDSDRIYFNEGDEVAIEAEEKDGRTFKIWELTEGDAEIASPSDAQTSVIIGTKDSVVKALYDDEEGDLTLTVDGGKIINGKDSYKPGDVVKISADEEDDQIFSKWELEEGDAEIASPSDAKTTVTMGEESSVIKAVFKNIRDAIDRIVKIFVHKKPVKTEYKLGEEFNPAGLVVKAEAELASPANAKKTFTLDEDEYEIDDSEYDADQPGEYEITVTYTGDADGSNLSDSFMVEVLDEEPEDEDYYVESIYVLRKPNKMSYKVDDEIDLTGLAVAAKIRGVDSNDRLDDLILDEDEYEVEYDFSTPGSRSVKIIYWGVNKKGDDKKFTTSFTVKVTGTASTDNNNTNTDNNNNNNNSNSNTNTNTGTSSGTHGSGSGSSGSSGSHSGGGGGTSKGVTSVKRGPENLTETEQAGTWKQHEDGRWSFTPASGQAAGWKYIRTAGGPFWYHFGEDGMMHTGWYQTEDGTWYWLEADGANQGALRRGAWLCDMVNGLWYYLDDQTGAMATGWRQIGGKWYMFNSNPEDENLPQGVMFSSVTTPDGYNVGEDGAWIQ